MPIMMLNLLSLSKRSIIQDYHKSEIRMYRADDYHLYFTTHMKEKCNLNNVLLTPEFELKLMGDMIIDIYKDLLVWGIFDSIILSKKDVLYIRAEIADKSYSCGIQVFEEEPGKAYEPAGAFSKQIKERIVPGGKMKMIGAYLTARDKLVLDSLYQFLQKKMMALCIGSDYLYNSNQPRMDQNPCPVYYGLFYRVILQSEPCCIGCYIDLSPLISLVNKDYLLYRLGLNLSSPDHLFRLFLNIGIKSADGDSLFGLKKGLFYVGPLTELLFYFLFNEFDFYLSRYGYSCIREYTNLFIGIPTHMGNNSSVDFIKDKIYKNIKDSLAKMQISVETLDDILSSKFLIEGESISLFGAQLGLRNNKFNVDKKNYDL